MLVSFASVVVTTLSDSVLDASSDIVAVLVVADASSEIADTVELASLALVLDATVWAAITVAIPMTNAKLNVAMIG